jgi:surface carbohydrate biosynthesis protein
MEIKQRELPSRLLIASKLLSLGHPVVLGQQWSIFQNFRNMPTGGIFFKTVNKIQGSVMQKFKNSGYVVYANDEESLICVENSCFCYGFSSLAAENCDLFFAQSSFHKGAITAKYNALMQKVLVAGSPRLEVISSGLTRTIYADLTREIKNRFGPFILFNTNFGSVNSVWGGIENVRAINMQAGVLNQSDAGSVAEFNDLFAWEEMNLTQMTQLIFWAVKNLRGYKIVIRPHPGENPSYWLERFGREPGVHVQGRSDPHPWILAAEATIHTGCTTGLEAKLLGKKSFNLKPSNHPVFDRIVNHVNVTFPTWSELAEALTQYLAASVDEVSLDSSTGANNDELLEKYIESNSDAPPSSIIAYEISRRLGSMGDLSSGQIFESTIRSSYLRCKRTAIQQDKFTLLKEELTSKFGLVTSFIRMPLSVNVEKLDDSVFLLSPTN